MIMGTGSLLTKTDELGNDIPFMTTDEILKQIERFGFYVSYGIKRNLPNNMLSYLATIDNLGYDKITRVALESTDTNGQKVWRPTVLVMKSEFNTDLLVFDCKLTRKAFNEKLANNAIVNVTNEPDMEWDWLHYICNIADVLAENVDDSDEFDPIEEPHPNLPFNPCSLTEYDSQDANEGDGEAEFIPTDSESGIYGSEVVDESE